MPTQEKAFAIFTKPLLYDSYDTTYTTRPRDSLPSKDHSQYTLSDHRFTQDTRLSYNTHSSEKLKFFSLKAPVLSQQKHERNFPLTQPC